MSERVHVVVRIRPFISSDPADAELNTLVLDSSHVSVGNNRVFKADRVYMMEDTTELIYAESVAPLIQRFLRGFNASVLAYGQTGTGKTFTVRSLLPLLLSDIVSDVPVSRGTTLPSTVEKHHTPATKNPLLYLQYVEVYGETIRDLLEGSAGTPSWPDGEEPTKIRLVTTTTATPGARAGSPDPEHAHSQPSATDEHDGAASPASGCALLGAAIVPIFTAAQASELIARGDTQRATGATNVHQHSSRSHAILTLFHPRYACRLDVVDLAGSEREKKTGNVGIRFQESIAINTGLLALGNVMRALSRNNKAARGREASRGAVGGGRGGGYQRAQHVPYRSSRLTRLLQDTLGGNSATMFIACVAPDTYNRDETLRTLQYCSLALRILNEPLQQYERLRRAQSPQGRRGSPSTVTATAVVPLSLLDGANETTGRAARGQTEDETTIAKLKVLELQSVYASLQQQYDEQAELISSLCASYEAVKGRLTLCEKELRKDECIFTQQIRAMQELVSENQKLRRRLSKASANVAVAAAAPPSTPQPEKAVLVHNSSFHGGDNRGELAGIRADSRRGGRDCTDGIQNLLHAGAHDVVLKDGHTQQSAPSKSPRNCGESIPPEAVTAAIRPQLASFSPHRVHGARIDVSDSAQYAQLQDGRRGAATPTHPAIGNSAVASNAVSGMTSGDSASTGSPEGEQSFIRHILALHGIDPEAKEKQYTEDDNRGSALVAAARNKPLRSPRPQSTATDDIWSTLQPTQASGRMAEVNGNGEVQQAKETSPPKDALSCQSARFIASPVNKMSTLSGDGHRKREKQLDIVGGETYAHQQDDSAVLLLASEVVRYQGTNAELRNQVHVLQTELDGKQREAALLRLELQEMKEFFTG